MCVCVWCERGCPLLELSFLKIYPEKFTGTREREVVYCQKGKDTQSLFSMGSGGISSRNFMQQQQQTKGAKIHLKLRINKQRNLKRENPVRK